MQMALADPRTDLVFPLRAEPAAVTAARGKLRAAGLDGDLEHTVSLLTSELVGNAVRHAGLSEGDRIVVAARLEPGWARIEVRDSGPGFDPEIRHSTRGYGLRLVEMLATRWGVDGDDGTRVWFEVDRRSGRSGRFGRG